MEPEPRMFTGWVRYASGTWVAVARAEKESRCWDTLLSYQNAEVRERLVLPEGDRPHGPNDSRKGPFRKATKSAFTNVPHPDPSKREGLERFLA